ncbi:type III secretion protein HrpF [Kosakonia sp. MUSA4]|uniref:type III secretion protein HrpF n=1 Tax=Kosakonia sp. MUSA4 TaxID=2067958 RepID=UPI00159B39F4|nr:type III secretion protein HrpF [Kosakonia sp. MUSA4]QJT82633.1 type III secretion protein HrpF [Kosakonia sp. MUSA4]
MSNSYDIQRNLDLQLARVHHSVAEFAQGTLSLEGGPGIGDVMAFKQELLQESAANYTASQLGSLKHNLSKEIIDSIN